jgi:integrase
MSAVIIRMASIWRHPHSQFWTACFRDGDGRQRRYSTKTTNRKLALRLASEYEKAARSKRTLHQLEKTLRAFHEELSGETGRYSLRSFCEEWLEEKRPSVSKGTREFYQSVVAKIIDYLGLKADRPLAEVTSSDLVKLRNALAEKISAATVNHNLVGIRMLFRDAKRLGRVAENPAEFLKPIRARELRETRRPFTIPELQKLLAAASPEWRSMIKLGLYTSQRLGDIALLRWNQIDLVREELRLSARKTGKTIVLPVAGPLRAHLLSLPSSDDPQAFVHPKAALAYQKKNSVTLLSWQFAQLLESVGLRQPGQPKETGERRRLYPLSFHSLRHTAVSFLKEAGIPQAVVLELAGHASSKMSARYTHVGREALELAAQAMPVL